MIAESLLEQLRQRGVELRLEGDRLRFSAPKGVMTAELRQVLADRKAELIGLLAAPAPSGPPPITQVPRDQPLPLSFLQQRLWFLEQLHPGSPAYNVTAAFRLAGHLDAAALERSVAVALGRHEALLTNVALVAQQPVARIATMPDGPLLLRHDLRHLPAAERESAAIGLATAAAQQPFDLTAGPLLRSLLIQIEPDRHLLALVTHHFAADGWSMGILIHEIITVYLALTQGATPQLPPLPVQYADYDAWQRRWLEGEDGRPAPLVPQLAYWREQLAGLPPPVVLPIAAPRPPAQSFRGATQSLQIGRALADALKNLSRQEHVTLFTTLLALFHLLLHRYSQQNDIVVATAISSRSHADVEQVVGPFSNNLLLRADLSGAPSFRALLKRVGAVVSGALAHQDLPFERLVAELQPERHLGYNPLFQVMFVLQNPPPPQVVLPGLTWSVVEIDNGTAKFDLTLSAQENDAGLLATLEYSSDLFDQPTIERLLGHVVALATGVVTNPDLSIALLPLLSEAERSQILGAWSGIAAAPPTKLLIHNLFDAQVARTPAALALVDGPQHLTYQEVQTRANQLAWHLLKRGIGPGQVVAICTEPCCDMIVAALAVLKAGAAYLPLDPAAPPSRLAWMLADARPALLLTQRALADDRWDAALPVLALDSQYPPSPLVGEGAGGEGLRSSPSPLVGEGEGGEGVRPDDLAYIIYTSGSTGQPKGVMLAHRGLCDFALHQSRIFGMEPGSRVLQFAPFSFDASVAEIFDALVSGATLCLAPRAVRVSPPDLWRLLRDQGITTATLPPSLLAVLAAEGLPALTTVIAAGEGCPPDVARRWSAGRRFLNAYGPTEATVGPCCHVVDDPASLESLTPIGRPLPAARAYILDRAMQPLPVGVPGELYIGGNCLARGYLNRPDLTAERFVPNPFATGAAHEARLYRTGDLARYRPDGVLECLGRADQQVKLRGFRVELGEIEAALGQHPAVAAASVVLREDTGEPRLVAYLVARELAAPPTDLRPFLRDRLPDYMLPAVSVWLPALPLTPNGKVDRAALPAPSATVRGKGTTQRIGKRSSPSPLVGEGAGGEGIRSPLERQLVRIWEQVLGVESVGIHDNFFDLGGHSLLTVRLADQIRRETGQSLPLSAIFQGGTVAQVAELLLGGAESLLWSPLVPIQTRGTRPPFFCVHPLLGVVFPYYELARQLGPDQPFYGLQAAGFDGTRPPLSQVEAMARHYLEALRVVQPEGPYRLGGWSFGSLVAFEMARQLSAQGQRVALLAVIDTPAPVEGHRITPLLLAQFAVAMLRISGRHIWPYLLEYMRLATTVDAHAGAGPGRWAAHRLLGQFAGLPAATNDDTLRALLFQQPTLRPLARVAVANARAAMRYQPQPYAGNIALIATETPAGSAAHPLQGWDRIAASVTRIIAPGNHLTLLQPPHVAPLAAQLRALLDT